MGLIVHSMFIAVFSSLLFQAVRLSTNNKALPKQKEFGDEDFVAPKGAFINLSHGEVHYVLEGDSKHQLVVLVHGLFSEARDMRHVVPLLENYQFLSFDLYGMGHSLAPANVRFDERLYVGQLAELLFRLGFRDPVILVGHSLGGAIASAFAARFPDSVKALIMVAPAGVVANVPFYAKYYIPVVTDVLARILGPLIIPKRVADAFSDQTKYSPIISQLQGARAYQFRNNPDYLSATFLCIQNFPIDALLSYFRDLSKVSFPIHAIWGVKDETTPVAGAAVLKQLIPNIELTLLQNVGHLVFHEAPKNISNVVKSVG